MTEKNKKRVTMRQQLRIKAEEELVGIKQAALDAMGKLAKKHGLDRGELVKAISVGSHKTADHFLVTQMANKAEDDLVKLWNDQQNLDLGTDKKDKK